MPFRSVQAATSETDAAFRRLRPTSREGFTLEDGFGLSRPGTSHTDRDLHYELKQASWPHTRS